MKPIRSAVGILILSVTAAFAVDYQDVDAIGVTLDGTSGGAPGLYQGMFDLSDTNEMDMINLVDYGEGMESDIMGYSGFPPAVLSAEVAFYLRDDHLPEDSSLERAVINLPRQWISSGWYHDFQYEAFDGNVGIAGRIQIRDSGTLNYNVYAGWGSSDFVIDFARLSIVTGSPVPVGVADSGLTLSLLGLALLSMSAISRKLKPVGAK